MKIYKKDDKIIFEFPLEQKRCNPYNHDMLKLDTCEVAGCTGTYPTFVGIVDEDRDGNEETGFAYTIDMDYKDKGDQYTEIVIKWYGEPKKFIKLCKELNIDYYDLRKNSL